MATDLKTSGVLGQMVPGLGMMGSGGLPRGSSGTGGSGGSGSGTDDGGGNGTGGGEGKISDNHKILWLERAGSPADYPEIEDYSIVRRFVVGREDRFAALSQCLWSQDIWRVINRQSKLVDSSQSPQYDDDGHLTSCSIDNGDNTYTQYDFTYIKTQLPGIYGDSFCNPRVEIEAPDPYDGDDAEFLDLVKQLQSQYVNDDDPRPSDYTEIKARLILFPNPKDQRTLPDVKSDIWLRYRSDFGGEYLQIPSQGVQWVASNVMPVNAAAIATARMTVIEHVLTMYGVKNPNWTALDDYVGCVNNAAFLGTQQESVMYDGRTIEPSWTGIDHSKPNDPNSDPDDAKQPLRLTWGYTITLYFREVRKRLFTTAGSQTGNYYGWNHELSYNPSTGALQWDRIQNAAGCREYSQCDLGDLFPKDT